MSLPRCAGKAIDPDATVDDILLRLRADGSRDTSIGNDGFLRIDHSAQIQSSERSFDRPLRIAPDGLGKLVGSANRNAEGDEDLLLSCRRIADPIFANGFE